MKKAKLTSVETETLDQLRNLTSERLHAELKIETSLERELLAKIVCYIYEVDRRKLYLKYDCASLFDYLVKEMKYSNASAQRRLDAARILADAPELANGLASGELTLSQVSIVAQGLKQAKRESSDFTSTAEVKRELLESVKSQSTANAQQIVAQALNLEIKAVERKVVQRDESLRLEVTFSKEEAGLLKEVKDLLSHSQPGASYRDVLVAGLKELKRRRNPAEKVGRSASVGLKVTSAAEVRRSVFKRDKACQWKHDSGQVCGSTFQLQIDHKKAKWLGGSDEEPNLQLLCSAHNRMKYQREIGLV